ncbi:hypothetical protein GCM10010102_41060 [Promicromonospora citrea]|uniref:Uncharacterized protein n=1 Tax=Promicromonospora citrea TaxID=43677 RepID=A0A8H9L6J6_9MICO|nr:hypothetical protein GCM10010102_41060 [Promicromonospora citrea]
MLAVGIGPDFSAVAGTRLLPIIGALLTITVLIAVAMFVICAFVWPIASATGNWQATSKARTGLLGSLIGGVISGGALAWTNWLIDLGHTF